MLECVVQCSVGEPDRPEQICASQWGINSKIREEKKKKEMTFLFFCFLSPSAQKEKLVNQILNSL